MKAKLRKRSIRRKFTFGLGAVVTGIILIFSVALTAYHGKTLERELQGRLNNLTKLAEKSLAGALWRYNFEFISEYIDSMFLFEELAKASVSTDNKIVKERFHVGLEGKSNGYFKSSQDFITMETDVYYGNILVGNVFLALSRDRVKNLIILESAGAIFLLILIIGAIFLTNYLLSKKYLFRPLSRLERSARAIAEGGDMSAPIDTESEDEIGQLARTFSRMIKKLKATTASRDELEDEIKERLRVENELKRSSSLLEATGKMARVGGWEYDTRNDELFLSREAYRIYDIPQNSKPSFDETFGYLHPKDKDTVKEAVEKALGEGRPYNLEARLVNSGGRELWVHSIGIPQVSGGKTVRLTGILQDITGRVKAEKEKASLEAQLRHAHKMEAIGTLAGGIAHDFNNLLGIIIGNISIALSSLDKDEELHILLKDSLDGAERSRNLAEQLITFSKGGAPVKSVLGINRLVKEAAEFAARKACSKLVFELDPHTWAVEVDEGQIRQVLGSLVANADESMPGGGVITLGTGNREVEEQSALPLSPGRYVKVFVQDRGRGIPKEDIPKIFDPFFTTREQGSGLGLATSYSIIKRHGGRMEISSKMGEGTTASFYLPASSKKPEKPKKPVMDCHKKGGRILIMDDEEAILTMSARMLGRMGYETEVARDGAAAVDMYEKALISDAPFDLVILDLSVPGGMGGAEAMRRLQKIHPDVKAIVSSGYSNDPVMANHEQHGFKGVVPKPYTRNHMARVLAKILGESPL